MNLSMISGYLGQDPEVRYFESGNVVAKLSVAVTNYKKETTWWTAECWGKGAEAAANHLTKGTFVIVQGEGSFDVWNDKQSGEAKGKPVVKNARWEFGGGNSHQSSNIAPADEF